MDADVVEKAPSITSEQSPVRCGRDLSVGSERLLIRIVF